MELRSRWEIVYVALLMLLGWRLQQHCHTLWFLYVAPGILLKEQRSEITVKSCITVVALCFVAFGLHQ